MLVAKQCKVRVKSYDMLLILANYLHNHHEFSRKCFLTIRASLCFYGHHNINVIISGLL